MEKELLDKIHRAIFTDTITNVERNGNIITFNVEEINSKITVENLYPEKSDLILKIGNKKKVIDKNNNLYFPLINLFPLFFTKNRGNDE